MTPSDMTVWDRLALLFPTCTSDEIRDWYGEDEFGVESYDVTDNTIRRPWQDHERSWLTHSQLRAAIDATKPRPWHVIAQEALADLAEQEALEIANNWAGSPIVYRNDVGDLSCVLDASGNISIYDSTIPRDAVSRHNEIASLLRAAGLTQFKCYRLVEDTE